MFREDQAAMCPIPWFACVSCLYNNIFIGDVVINLVSHVSLPGITESAFLTLWVSATWPPVAKTWFLGWLLVGVCMTSNYCSQTVVYNYSVSFSVFFFPRFMFRSTSSLIQKWVWRNSWNYIPFLYGTLLEYICFPNFFAASGPPLVFFFRPFFLPRLFGWPRAVERQMMKATTGWDVFNALVVCS